MSKETVKADTSVGVLGDTDHVVPLPRQLLLDPFKVYATKERDVLDHVSFRWGRIATDIQGQRRALHKPIRLHGNHPERLVWWTVPMPNQDCPGCEMFSLLVPIWLQTVAMDRRFVL